MRVKVEDNDGNLLAMVAIFKADERGVCEFEVYSPDREPWTGSVWGNSAPMRTVADVLRQVASRGPR